VTNAEDKTLSDLSSLIGSLKKKKRKKKQKGREEGRKEGRCLCCEMSQPSSILPRVSSQTY
jgi:predicted transposase YdaD